jgi:cobalt/nickel transport system permease protein
MNYRRNLLLLALLLLMLLPSPAAAMHISEGILPFSWALFWFIASAPFLALGLRTLARRSENDLSSKPLVGMVAAVVFVISCMPIPVPLAGTCSHPCGTGLAAILLGPTLGVVVAAVALLIQALFLSHGGLSTWGANLFAMGVLGSFGGYLVFRGLRLCRVNLIAAAFMAGLAADWATYAGTALIMAAGIRGSSPFWPLAAKIVLAFVPTQLPLGVIEGVMTAGMISLLRKKRPDLLERTALSYLDKNEESSIEFKNPQNGYIEKSPFPGFWCFIFGPFYLAVKGVWGHALFSFFLAVITCGISWLLIYPFFARSIIRKNYLRRGWEELA